MKHFIITIFLAHFLLIAFAQNNVIIQAPDVQVNADDEITYPITINPNGNSIGSFQFKIEYDNTLLEILNIERPDGWLGAFNPNTPGIIIIGFFNLQVENAMFEAVSLTFKAIGQAGQTSQIKLSEGLVFDDIGQINHQFSNGSIAINSCNPLDGNNACKADLIVNCGNANVTGNTLSVSNVVVTNSGNAEARYSFIRYYLSSDEDITSSDYYLGLDYVSALGEGATSNENITIDLSSINILEGTYYLGILADFYNQVDESNETNNTCYISNPTITIQDSPPQGTITVTAPNGNDVYQPGDVINIKWTDNISENVLIRMHTSTGSYLNLTNSTASDGSYNHTIHTGRNPGQYRISIQSTANGSINHYGDYFTIQQQNANCTVLTSTQNYSENFESFGQGSTSCGATITLTNGWTNDTNDDVDWTVDVGGTSSGSTGPATDSNPGTATGKYLYVEASGSCQNSKAVLSSSCFDLTGLANPNLSFSYHMYGSTMGGLRLGISTDGGNTVTWQNIAQGNQGNTWRNRTGITLPSQDNVQILFEATTGVSFTSDIALDNVQIIGSNNKVGEDDILDTRSYPNPFTDHATIAYTLPKDSPVTLTVYDASGKQIALLHDNETKTRGPHTATFEGSLYPTGMYYYTIQAGEYFGTQKMLLMK